MYFLNRKSTGLLLGGILFLSAGSGQAFVSPEHLFGHRKRTALQRTYLDLRCWSSSSFFIRSFAGVIRAWPPESWHGGAIFDSFPVQVASRLVAVAHEKMTRFIRLVRRPSTFLPRSGSFSFFPPPPDQSPKRYGPPPPRRRAAAPAVIRRVALRETPAVTGQSAALGKIFVNPLPDKIENPAFSPKPPLKENPLPPQSPPNSSDRSPFRSQFEME